MNDQAHAVTRLQQFLAAGALYVIRVTHRCQPGLHAIAARTPEEQAACAAWSDAQDPKLPPTDPRHFEASPVVDLRGPDAKGRYKAVAEDGSFTIGYPAALLKRLTEYALAG